MELLDTIPTIFGEAAALLKECWKKRGVEFETKMTPSKIARAPNNPFDITLI